MTPIRKPHSVPEALTNAEANAEFQKNIEAQAFVGKDVYRKVRTELEALYHSKCAYCESKITTIGYSRIEHYRPKSNYYWLAYSWDNLLLACERCNTNKGNKFEISGTKIEYANERLDELQTNSSKFDTTERPKIVNPEQVSDFSEHLTFNLNAELIGISDEMNYTINICKLNREELKESRFRILNNHKFSLTLQKDKIQALLRLIKELEYSISKNEDFIAWKTYLAQHYKLILKRV